MKPFISGERKRNHLVWIYMNVEGSAQWSNHVPLPNTRQLHTSHDTNNVRKCVTLVGTFRGYMIAACMWYEKRWLKQLRNNNIFKQFVL